jgi:hypothetical protein
MMTHGLESLSAGRVAAALALALLSSERGGDCIPSALATSNTFHSLN